MGCFVLYLTFVDSFVSSYCSINLQTQHVQRNSIYFKYNVSTPSLPKKQMWGLVWCFLISAHWFSWSHCSCEVPWMYVVLVTMHWFTFRTHASIILEYCCFFDECGAGSVSWSLLGSCFGGLVWVLGWVGVFDSGTREQMVESEGQRKDTQKWIEAGVFTSLFWPGFECVSVGGWRCCLVAVKSTCGSWWVFRILQLSSDEVQKYVLARGL